MKKPQSEFQTHILESRRLGIASVIMVVALIALELLFAFKVL